MMTNPYLSAARAHKVQAIIAVFDAAIRACGGDPLSDAAVRKVIFCEPVDFARAALIAGVRAPSAETIKAVTDFYIERAKQAQEAGRARA